MELVFHSLQCPTLLINLEVVSHIENPYLLSSDNILDAPTSFWGKLKHLGPGFILSASIVGSGELIATTTLGAKAGFVTLWIILVSCVVKVALQLEFGKHAILNGETAIASFNKLPGPRFGKGHWTIWTILILMIVKFTQVGGIIGGVAIAGNIFLPQLSVTTWAAVVALSVALLVFKGYYQLIEKMSIVMIALFTLLTFTSLYFLQDTSYALTWAEISSGFRFELPAAAVAVAIGAFGITGVGGDEIIHYTYWCIEKGYAQYTGVNDGTEEWERRAKGWINVMKLDAIIAMIVYTVMTGAFYLLGAAVLHEAGTVPEGYGMLETLSSIYTETLGEGAKTVFLAGAVIVLFSTLFSALAAWTRQYTDMFSQVGFIDFVNQEQRMRTIGILSFVLPAGWMLLFLFVKLPVAMVIFGGIITSVILLLIIYVAFEFRYRQTPEAFKPTMSGDISLWISMIVILMIAVYGIVKII